MVGMDFGGLPVINVKATGNNIDRLRTENGISYKDIQYTCGVSFQAVYKCWVLAHVLPESATIHFEPMEENLLYTDNQLHTMVSSYAPPRITMEFVEYPTSRGHYHIISERGAVSSTELNMDLEV